MAESLLVPILPQIQVTLDCNYRCSYCFQNHDSCKVIDPGVAALILAKSARFNKSVMRGGPATVEVYWHGGEPLLAGPEFFREMLRVQLRFPSVTFHNRLQTNGSLLSGELAEFLVERQFQLGFSLDGPPAINDLQRRFSGVGESAFDATWRGIQNFRRYAPKGRVPVIAVITRESAARAKEIYAFFKEIEAQVQLDIYDLRCADLRSDHDGVLFRQAPSQDEVRDFLIELFDLWFHDPERRVDFQELKDELDRVLEPERCFPNPVHKKRCSPARTIFNPDGIAFSCDQYVNDPATAIGDIRRDSVAAIMRKKAEVWERIKQAIRPSPAAMGCSRCEWGSSCAGGCMTCIKFNSMLLDARAKGLPDDQWPMGSVAEPIRGLAGEMYYCDAMRALRDHIRKKVQHELAKTDAL
jgi:uncharacterized protein